MLLRNPFWQTLNCREQRHDQESDYCRTICKRLSTEIKAEHLTLMMNKVMGK